MKIVLVVAILNNKVWAYPWMIAFLGAISPAPTMRIGVTDRTQAALWASRHGLADDSD